MTLVALFALAFSVWMAWSAFDSLRDKNGYLQAGDYITAVLVAGGSLSGGVASGYALFKVWL